LEIITWEGSREIAFLMEGGWGCKLLKNSRAVAAAYTPKFPFFDLRKPREGSVDKNSDFFEFLL
jgi:hypothetical protein